MKSSYYIIASIATYVIALIISLKIYVNIFSLWQKNICKQFKSNKFLFFSVLFWSGLFCSVLFCSGLVCSVLVCSVLFWSGLFWSGLFCSVLFCSVLFWSVLVRGPCGARRRLSAYSRYIVNTFTSAEGIFNSKFMFII